MQVLLDSSSHNFLFICLEFNSAYVVDVQGIRKIKMKFLFLFSTVLLITGIALPSVIGTFLFLPVSVTYLLSHFRSHPIKFPSCAAPVSDCLHAASAPGGIQTSPLFSDYRLTKSRKGLTASCKQK